MNTEWWLVVLLAVIVVVLLVAYTQHLCAMRNESEYRDIMEYQTMLVAALLKEQPSLLKTISQIRYFPDQSGFFIVLDYDNKLLAHGDYHGDLTQKVPFDLPAKDLVDLAKQGGGYMRLNYRGHLYDFFVYAYANSPFVVVSGLSVDSHHVANRCNWKRVQRTLMRKAKKI
jgi:hypothetical protein